MGLISAILRFISLLRLALNGWGSVSGPEYHHFRNVILSTSRGTSEIDHLIVSKFGLFVIEEKKYSGWIFAGASDPFWTAMYFGNKYRFQNPLYQNYGHVKALEEVAGVSGSKIFPLVLFRGRFEFKTDIPDGVFLHSCSSWIAEKSAILLSDAEVERMLDVVQQAATGFFATLRHTASIRSRYRSTTTCPKCRGTLVARVARSGPMPGSQFLGCSNYPRCKYTRNAVSERGDR